MLALKLVLVPFFLLLVTLAGRRWGTATAGWLAGFPVVTGPILFFIATEQGVQFAGKAATSSLGAVVGVFGFSVVYSRLAQGFAWPIAWMASVLSWFATASLTWLLPANVFVQGGAALASLLLAPRLYPQLAALPPQETLALRGELLWRLVAGATLCWLVTSVSARLGTAWSGLLAVFPVLTSVLVVFTHRGQGATKVVAMLSAMARGLYSLAAFCLILALALPRLSIASAFAIAIFSALLTQWISFARARNFG